MLKCMMGIAAATAVAALGSVALAQSTESAAPKIKLEPFVEGLNQPLAMVETPDGRMLVIEQWGRVMVVEDGELLGTPFLDIRNLIIDRHPDFDERGLLGLALHPDFANNGKFYVAYSGRKDWQGDLGQMLWYDHNNVVAEYTVSEDDPNAADRYSGRILSSIPWPQFNHNGHWIGFGPDGMLYVSTGDGGYANDWGIGHTVETGNGQDLTNPLGKILRIDPETGEAAEGNPFADNEDADPRIWAYGLRNPWRCSFDTGGENYGWDCREGFHDFETAGCPAGGFTDPVIEYSSQSGTGRCSVTGGYRYRGGGEPRLRGVYLFADFCSGEILGTVPRCDGLWETRVLYDAPFNVTAFGEDEAGEVYVTEYHGDASATSRVHLLALAPGSGGPDLVASPDPLDFGTVEAGDTVTGIVTLTNANTGPEALILEPAALSDPARFDLDLAAGSAPCRTPRRCLPPGASCTLGVALRAAAPATVDETLAFAGTFAPEVVQLAAEVVPCSTVQDLTLSDRTVDGVENHRACDTLTAAPDVTVTATGDLTLCGGTRVVLGSGFRVLSGGRLALSTSC